ncbi:MAG: MPT63 family protein [Mycobacterium sp.]|nr:MPT63 family protein [Mycobacterium sp.]
MKQARFLTAAITTAAAGAAGLAGAAAAWAEGVDPAVQPLGQQGEVVDGGSVQSWTVTGLQPSVDAIPYQPGGVLWEATATDQAVAGGAIPLIPAFSARAANGDDYRALWQVPTALGVNPSGLAQGQSTTGKLYFDVTAAVPDSVVYTDDGQDQLIWVQPPPSAETGPSGYNGSAAWPATGGQSVSGMPQSGSSTGSAGAASAEATPNQAAGQSVPGASAAAADDVHGAATAAQPKPATAPLDVHDTTAPATSPAQVPSAQGTATAPAAAPTASAPAAAATPAPAAAPASPTTKAPAPAS